MLDPSDLAQEADFRAQLDQVERTFTEPVAVDEGRMFVKTGPLFGASWSTRAKLPTFNAGGGFDLEAITDPSFGGVVAGLSREKFAPCVSQKLWPSLCQFTETKGTPCSTSLRASNTL